MEKRISYDEFMSVKRVAQAVNPLKVKRDKVLAKMNGLEAEYKSYDTQIATLEAGIKQIIGYRTEELVKKVIETSTNKEGKEVKTTKYVPTDIVSYDKDHKQYVINDATLEAKPKAPAEEKADPAHDSDNWLDARTMKE